VCTAILIGYCLLVPVLADKHVEVWFTADCTGETFENAQLVKDSWGHDVSWQQPYLDRFLSEEEVFDFAPGCYYVHVSIGKSTHLREFDTVRPGHTYGRAL
jgi:hypothetical protein